MDTTHVVTCGHYVCCVGNTADSTTSESDVNQVYSNPTLGSPPHATPRRAGGTPTHIPRARSREPCVRTMIYVSQCPSPPPVGRLSPPDGGDGAITQCALASRRCECLVGPHAAFETRERRHPSPRGDECRTSVEAGVRQGVRSGSSPPVRARQPPRPLYSGGLRKLAPV